MATFAKIASPSAGPSASALRISWTKNNSSHCDLEVSWCWRRHQDGEETMAALDSPS